MDLLPHFSTTVSTSIEEENFGNHVGETGFHSYFKLAKDRWIVEVLATNQFTNIHFVTRKYSIEIKKEVLHPSQMTITCSCVSFEGARVHLALTLALQHHTVAVAGFELVPVDVTERKIVTKTKLYENSSPKPNQHFF